MARLLITGGTGSFGGAAVRHFLKAKDISEIVIFSRDEAKQHHMRYSLNESRLSFVIGDVRDRDAITRASRGIDYIFHAAALKHVPTGEFFPMELVRTNILGTENVVAAAEANGVKKMILLSTDKAVYPINAMGMSKAVAEKLISARAREKAGTVFCAVRYGNVMGSRGSVIPLFIDHIQAGRQLPITDPSMTRFLLSLEDSVALVETAIKKGEQGDLFIKKAPAATVMDIADALIEMFGTETKKNIVGVRAGEKIHETLATLFELARAEDLGDYYRIHDVALFKYDEFFKKGVERKELESDYTSENTTRLDRSKTKELLLTLPFIQGALKA